MGFNPLGYNEKLLQQVLREALQGNTIGNEKIW